MTKHVSLLALLAAISACAHPTMTEVAPIRGTADTVHISGSPSASAGAQSDIPFGTMGRVDWPGPNSFRSASGAPGPDYWQQRADYSIAAALDTTARHLTGKVTIRYTNNSPDTLRFIWLQLDQNLYRAGSKGSTLFAADTRFGDHGFEGGYDFKSVSVDGKPAAIKVDDTMGRIDLDTPIVPRGGKTTIVIEYDFNVPEHGSDRMGRDGPLYEVAQWYPRMAVFDDVRGWNTDPYLGQGEFYLEYGDIDYAVTVPAGYVVAGSGVLENASDVLSAEQRKRVEQASKSASVVQVITESEAKPTPTPGTKTWRFRARSVRDVAWAGAPDFRWDATSWNGILCQAFYEWPKAGHEWTQVAENNQWTIRTYSDLIYPYPYPQATSVAGPVAGMEYPMFVMDGYTNPQLAGDVFRTNDHEHGHEWFPMIVGSNERRYAWQDEGFNTYINTFSQERRYGGDPAAWPQGMDNAAAYATDWHDVKEAGVSRPLMTAPDHIDQRALGALAYQKPAMVMLLLRDHVVGRDVMDRAMREYARRWAFKHPTPGDWFRTIENVSGQELGWYWRAFWYGDDVLDIGIEAVANGTTPEGERVAKITLKRMTSIPFPVELRLKLADGSTQDVRFPVDIWAHGDTYEALVTVKSNVVGARLWPDPDVPDFVDKNDVWGDPPPRNPVRPATIGGLATPIGAPQRP
ncbi:MAG: M1 family metallopeptidase [Gemmatimonadota bacterium]|nr:M1 family metallopeptidase [Gemmatimonadota bacterium]